MLSAALQFSRNDHVHNASRKAPPRAIRSTVLHLAADLDIDASAREVVDLAIQTHRSGWRPIVASAGGALVMEAERAAVRHTKMPLNKRHIFARWRSRVQLEALFQRERPGMIHVHGLDILPHALGLAKTHHLPLLLDVTDPVPTTRRNIRLLKTAAQRGCWLRVPSRHMVDHLREDLKLECERIHLVPPGVDLLWFDASRVSPERLQKLSELWRLPEQATILVMATPLAPGYGHRQLLEALARLKRPDVFTVFVGNDRKSPGMRQDIERQILAFGLEGRVVMPDHCSDWPAACWLSTIVAATNTLPRGYAMELLAAQAIGRPVIVTDCGANAEMVKGGETAWIVSPDNVDMLAQALDEAVQMTGVQRIDLAKRTRLFTSDSFPQDRWCAALTGLYGTMLGHAPSPRTA